MYRYTLDTGLKSDAFAQELRWRTALHELFVFFVCGTISVVKQSQAAAQSTDLGERLELEVLQALGNFRLLVFRLSELNQRQ